MGIVIPTGMAEQEARFTGSKEKWCQLDGLSCYWQHAVTPVGAASAACHAVLYNLADGSKSCPRQSIFNRLYGIVEHTGYLIGLSAVETAAARVWIFHMRQQDDSVCRQSKS